MFLFILKDTQELKEITNKVVNAIILLI
jgi:hypothetical protein